MRATVQQRPIVKLPCCSCNEPVKTCARPGTYPLWIYVDICQDIYLHVPVRSIRLSPHILLFTRGYPNSRTCDLWYMWYMYMYVYRPPGRTCDLLVSDWVSLQQRPGTNNLRLSLRLRLLLGC